MCPLFMTSTCNGRLCEAYTKNNILNSVFRNVFFCLFVLCHEPMNQYTNVNDVCSCEIRDLFEMWSQWFEMHVTPRCKWWCVLPDQLWSDPLRGMLIPAVKRTIPITLLYTKHFKYVYFLKNASLSLLTLVLKSKQKDKNSEFTEDAIGAVLIFICAVSL